jgi:hypothetical protein
VLQQQKVQKKYRRKEKKNSIFLSGNKISFEGDFRLEQMMVFMTLLAGLL